jgi:hypothetical protein
VTAQQIVISVSADSVPEGPENFAVNLSNAVGATIADPQGVGLIVDDDAPLPGTAPAAAPGPR